MAGPSILVRFLADTKELKKAADETSGHMGKIQSGALKTAGAIGGAFAALKVIEFGKDAVGAASDLNESISKVGVVFGSSAKSVQDFAKTAATSMGMSQQAALEATATYGNLAVSLGLSKPVAATMSTSLVKLAGDLSSFNNVPIEDSLEALKSGMVGEVEPLRRFGVSLSAVQVQAEALRLGLAKAPVDMGKVNLATGRLTLAQENLVKAQKKYGKNSDEVKRANLAVASAQRGLDTAMQGGQVTLTAAAKAQATYSLIMQQTKTAQGDFARTSGGLANQQRIAAAQFEDLKAKVGTALLPVIVKLTKVFTQDLVPILKTAAEFIQKNSSWLLPLAGAILAVVAAAKIWIAVETLVNAVMDANPIGAIIIAIAALAAGIIYLATKTQFFQTIWAGIHAAFEATWRWLKANWPYLTVILLGPFGLLVGWLIKHKDDVIGFFKAAWNWLKTTWNTVTDIITKPVKAAVKWFEGLPKTIGDIFVNVATAIGAPFRFIFNAIARLWNNTIGRLSFHIPSWVPGLGGKGFDVPDIPTLAQGGLITSSGLVFAHAGEVISPIDKVPRGPAVHVEHLHLADTLDVDLFMRKAAWAVQTGSI